MQVSSKQIVELAPVNRLDSRAEQHDAIERWPLRTRFLFIVAAALTCWLVLIYGVWLLATVI